MIKIWKECPEDAPAIRSIIERAFGQPQEADLVEMLRRGCDRLVLLVAMDEGLPVGHVLFSPAVIEAPGGVIRGMGLAPVAVLPECQRRGVGSALIREGIEKLRSASCPFIIVMGHADYYPRFGFESASRRNIRPQWEGIPDESFMLLILDEPAMRSVSGVARYRKEFDDAI